MYLDLDHMKDTFLFIKVNHHRIQTVLPFKVSTLTTASYSLSGRHPEKLESISPGPGAYSENSMTAVLGKPPAYSMGSRSPTKINNETPGPGAYTYA